MRINRRGLILGSKPCQNCDKLLKAVGLDNIFWSNDDGSFYSDKQEIQYASSKRITMAAID